MTLVNETLNSLLNGELGNETVLNRPADQLLANDHGLDTRLIEAETRILALKNGNVDDMAFFGSIAF